jgi:hypothetical protein
MNRTLLVPVVVVVVVHILIKQNFEGFCILTCIRDLWYFCVFGNTLLNTCAGGFAPGRRRPSLAPIAQQAAKVFASRN